MPCPRRIVVSMKLAILIVAAGKGIRAGGKIPKQYRDLCGKTVLRHTIDTMLGFQSADTVTVVISATEQKLYRDTITGINDPRLQSEVAGGDTRQISVRNGLESLTQSAPDFVLIHDAARPLTPNDLIGRVVDALRTSPGALPVLPVVDALWQAQGDEVQSSRSRSNLVRAQTPQGFHFQTIMQAHRAADADAPDDVTIARQAGLEVRGVAGDSRNFKITLAQDFLRAEQLLEQKLNFRCGNGFDVHAFEAGNKVVLCGIEIPHSHGLKGHSDADVAMHAITDAIYGALAQGDIGRHFPPDDQQWLNAVSEIFLAHAVNLAKEQSMKINNIDCTIICEHPKITPHAGRMVAEIARIAGIDTGSVSIKATTSEGLGFTGRGEGIAAMATATLVRK